MKTVVLLSGGLDSAVCLHLMVKERGQEGVLAITVDYEQPHQVEVEYAALLAKRVGVSHRVVTIRGLYDANSGGFFSEDADLSVAAQTVVPMRNLILLSHAAVHGDVVVIGANRDDQDDYPDCRQEFFNEASKALGVKIEAPLISKTKSEVIALAADLGIELSDTLSCYRGANCGSCAACLLREGAL